MYMEYEGKKHAVLNDENGVDINSVDSFFINPFNITNKWDYLKFLLKVKISLIEYNDKLCYCINIKDCLKEMSETVGDILVEEGEDFNIDDDLDDYDFKFYIEKETGLIIYNPFQMTEYTYQFDSVTEDDVAEPDISEYEILHQ